MGNFSILLLQLGRRVGDRQPRRRLVRQLRKDGRKYLRLRRQPEAHRGPDIPS